MLIRTGRQGRPLTSMRLYSRLTAFVVEEFFGRNAQPLVRSSSTAERASS